MRLEDAKRVIAAAEKKAAEIGQPMNIAVAAVLNSIMEVTRAGGSLGITTREQRRSLSLIHTERS